MHGGKTTWRQNKMTASKPGREPRVTTPDNPLSRHFQPARLGESKFLLLEPLSGPLFWQGWQTHNH